MFQKNEKKLIVINNSKIHCSEAAIKELKKLKLRFLLLPTYLLWLNSIVLPWETIKKKVARIITKIRQGKFIN